MNLGGEMARLKMHQSCKQMTTKGTENIEMQDVSMGRDYSYHLGAKLENYLQQYEH